MAAIQPGPDMRMLLLMISEHNPLWKEILPGAANQTTIAGFTGISPTSPWSWQKDSQARNQTVTKICNNILEKLKDVDLSEQKKTEVKDKLAKFETAYKEENVRPLEVAKIFGMDETQCRKILDTIIYKKRPLLPTAYYAQGDANKHLKRHEGAYQLLIRMNERWIRCAMHVRYVVSVARNDFIRCKINIPVTGKSLQQEHSIYDGVLVVKPNHLFWMFEARDAQSEIEDFSYFITRSKGNICPVVGKESERAFSLAGTYLTTSQTFGHPIVSDRIILQYIKLKNYAARENYMDGKNKDYGSFGFIDDKQECESINAMWQELTAL